MEANYNESNFFARIFDCKMVIWEEKNRNCGTPVGAKGSFGAKRRSLMGKPSTGL